jgi:hypothetical protein
LIIVPGASGKISKRMQNFIDQYLSAHFTTCIRKGKWKGWKPLGDVNVSSVLELVPAEGMWFAMGNSFGNRVLCDMFSVGSFDNPPHGLILCGYPLYGEKCTPDRIATLQSLPSSTKVLAISGTDDEFLARAPSHSELRGEALFRSVVDTMSCKAATTLHMVTSGGHGVLDVGINQFDSVADSVLGWIMELVNSATC